MGKGGKGGVPESQEEGKGSREDWRFGPGCGADRKCQMCRSLGEPIVYSLHHQQRGQGGWKRLLLRLGKEKLKNRTK